MDFTLEDMKQYLGKQKATGKFICFRRYNLGYQKNLVRNIGSRHGKADVLRSIIHFNPDNVIKLFEKRIKQAKSDAFTTPRRVHLESWKDNINIAKHFKDV